MPIPMVDYRILQGLNPPSDPIAGMARVAQLRSLLLGNDAASIDIQQKRKALQDVQNADAAARAAFQRPAPVTTQAPSLTVGGDSQSFNGVSLPGNPISLPGSRSTVQGPAQFDRQKFLDTLSQTDPLTASNFQSHFDAQDAAQAKDTLDIKSKLQGLSKGDLEMGLTKLKAAGQVMGAALQADPKIRPQIYAQGVQQLKSIGAIDPNHPEQYPGDDAVKSELYSAMDAYQQFQSAHNQASDAETARHNKATEQNQVSTGAETARHHRTMEATAAQANAPANLQQQAEMLVEGQMDPSQLSRRSSSYGGILAAANQYSQQKYGKPFDAAKASTDYKYATNVGTQNTLKYLNSLTGANGKPGNLDTLIGISNGIQRTSFPALNDAAAWARLQTGDPAMAQYHAALTEVSDQVAKILQGGGMGTSDAKLRQAQDLFNNGFTKQQIQAVGGTLRDLLSNRKRELIGDNTYLQRSYGSSSNQHPFFSQFGGTAR